jgi:hypothetical protein
MNPRSMSGVNLSDEGGDVFQNGDNVFTGTNTYNVNLPTSGVTPTLSNQLITKAFADATYAGGGAAGDVFLAGTNAFTGTNTYNTNRPTSNIVGGVGLVSDDFITKADGDSIYGSGDGDAVLAGTNAFTGTNTFNTNRPTSNIVGGVGLVSDDFITKADGDSIYGSGDGDAVLAGTNAFTGTNTFNTNRPTSAIVAGVGLASDDFITKADGDSIYGSGDALLAGGLTEAAPQEFTGFNNFTKDTHFDEDIDADDTIRLNGSSAAANIAAISMVGGDIGGVVGGNTIGQNEAGTYGNSIYQISDTTVPIILPAANGCIIHQTGNTDIIRTEGKVQMALAPAVGDDLCNKTYVDAAGGGGVRVFQSPVKFASAGTPASPTNGTLLWARPSDRRNDQFPTMKPSSGADSLELSLLTTGYFTATSYDVGVWNFQLNLNIYPAFSTAVDVRFYHYFGSGAAYQQDKGIYFTDSHSAWLQLNSSCMLDMALGDSMAVVVSGISSIAPGPSYTNLSGTFLG